MGAAQEAGLLNAGHYGLNRLVKGSRRPAYELLAAT